MTTSNDPDEIRAEIERTRAELSYNVDELADTANPKKIAARQVNRVRGAAQSVRDRVMGAPDDPSDTGTAGDALASAQDKAAAARDAVGGAPAAARAKTQGNPLAAGLIAFGAGLLVSSLIPSSQAEQQKVSELQKNLEPLKERASGVAQELAENLREPAQQAAESVRQTAVAAADNVKGEAQSAKDDVSSEAEQAKARVQDAQAS